MIFHNFMKNAEMLNFWDFPRKTQFRPTRSSKYIRNDNKYVGFRAGGRGSDEKPAFSWISMEFHEIERNSLKIGEFT